MVKIKDKNRNIRKQWTQENLERALAAIIDNNQSQREVSTRFGIPRRTLRRYIRDGGASIKRLGRPSILSPEQERDFVQRIIRYSEIGLPLTSNLVRHQAYRYCNRFKIANNFSKKNEMAGKDWLLLFMRRHPEISRRKAQSMNPARAQKMNKPIVADYFQKLGQVLDELNLKNKPQCIYNMDEKGCRLTIHHQQTVLALRGSKRIHLIAPEHAENVTVVGCANAIGNAIPPMVIFKGKRLKPEYCDNVLPGTLIKMAPKGSMVTDLFIEFLHHLARHKVAGPALLIFDGASSHLDLSIVEAADDLNITLFCLPSNTTHELQPLDKSVYKSFESHWDAELLRYWDVNPDRSLTKARFNIILSQVYPKCMTPENIVNGFRATGIYPFNPLAIPDCAFAPAQLSERPQDVPVHLNEPQNCEYSSEDDIPLASLMRRKRKEENSLTNILETDKRQPNNPEANRSLSEPLDLDESFKELLPTPDGTKRVTKRNRRKAINYKAQKVTKNLFNESDCQPSTSRQSNPSLSKPVESWYCSICDTDQQMDMRLCSTCLTYYHEECVGLTADDEDDFECPNCS